MNVIYMFVCVCVCMYVYMYIYSWFCPTFVFYISGYNIKASIVLKMNLDFGNSRIQPNSIIYFSISKSPSTLKYTLNFII